VKKIKATKVNIVHGTSGTLLPKVWDVREQANTKLGQEDSLGLRMRLT